MSHHVMSWLLPLDSNSVLNYICYHTGQLNSLFETLHDQDGKKKPIWKIFCASVWQQECFPQILILLINFGIINKKQFSTVKQSCSLNSSSRWCCDGYGMWCNGWKDHKEHLIFHIAVLHETLRYPWMEEIQRLKTAEGVHVSTKHCTGDVGTGVSTAL